MITQVLALIAIGGCIYLENRHLYEEDNTDETIRVSGFLWYMIAAGYVTPVIGFFSYFLVTFYWVQEFPIALCLDMISLAKTKRGPEDFIDVKEQLEEPRETLKTIAEVLKCILPDFKKMHNRNWCFKFTYPFRTPVIVVLCVLYALMQMAFAGLAIIILGIAAIDEEDSNDPSNSNDPENLPNVFFVWLIYFSVGTGIGAIANAYVFAVAAFWTMIVPMLVMALAAVVSAVAAVLAAVVLALCIPLLFCAFAASGETRTQSY